MSYCTSRTVAGDNKTGTYDKRFYLDEFMEWGVVRLFELFADVEEVDLRPGHHDADESPVISAQTLKWGEGVGEDLIQD